ncbi:hypothetical protein [Actinotalea sp. JY-7885]|uniref:hypothetical protein n=1 Tax=Actinotalea sp. JY-7885 TaxID=2758576 RepID=UPI00165D3642|nr:hypothetical protein [Actinotalea sp. JY-7885]
MSDPLFWLALTLALGFGAVGAVFLTTARQVIAARGLRWWLGGAAVTVGLFAAMWWVDAAADGPGPRYALLTPAVVLGIALARPLRTHVLTTTTAHVPERPEPRR